MSGLFGGGSKAPAPDPAIGQAALMNAELAKEMAAVGREQLEEARRQYDELAPFYKDILDQQVRIGASSELRSDQQWQDYLDIFRPAEKKMAEEAMAAGSPAEMEAAAGRAAGSVSQQFGVAKENANRQAMAFGVNPGSARFEEIGRSTGIQEAAAVAGASNQAREAEKARGIALRSGVAQFGRNMPQTGIASDSLALSGGNAANATIGGQMATRQAGVASAMPWFGGAVSGNTAAGNLHLGQFGAQMQGYNANQNAQSGLWGGLGNIAGMYAGSAAGSKAIAGLMSSKKVKTNRESIAQDGVLEKVKSMPVEKWDYKQGIADGGTHIGPYAEDVHAKFGDVAAPGGKQLDPASMIGITLASIKALAKKVDRLEGATA
jgi:hypothetical protein